MDVPQYLSGQALLALPGIGDPRFEHAVIAMCAHDEQGALGIGIGQVIEGVGFHDLLKQCDIDPGEAPNAPVCLGGPVERNRGFILHSMEWSGQDSVNVAGRFMMTGTLDILRSIAQGRGPDRWMAALGYAGWGAGQLEEELMSHGWFSVDMTNDLLFASGAEDVWRAGFRSAGVDPAAFTVASGRA